jgi:hypothetical protein
MPLCPGGSQIFSNVALYIFMKSVRRRLTKSTGAEFCKQRGILSCCYSDYRLQRTSVVGSDAPFAAEVHSFLRGKIKRQSPQRLSAILDLETEVYQRRNGIHSHHLTAGNPRLHMRQPAQPGTRYRYYVSQALLHMPTVLAKIESSFGRRKSIGTNP